MPVRLWNISVLQEKPGHFDFAADPSSQQFRVLLSLWECCIIISDGCRRRTSTWGRIAAPCDGTHSGPPSRPQSQPGYWHALFILPKDARTRIQNKGLWMKLWYSKTMCLFSSAVLLNHLLGLWHHVCFSRITHVLAALLFEKTQFQYWGWCQYWVSTHLLSIHDDFSIKDYSF